MRKRYRVTLTPAEREQLVGMSRRGRMDARVRVHAGILLKADEGSGRAGWTDARIADALECGTATVERVRRRFVEEGLEAALERRRPRREYARTLDGESEAHLIAMACSQPPEGRSRWTLRLLADRMVQLEYVEQVSYQTVRRTHKKTN